MSDIEDIIVVGAAAISIVRLLRTKSLKHSTRRRFWVHSYLQGRNTKGKFSTTMEDLLLYEPYFQTNFHCSIDAFNALFERVEESLRPKANTRPKDAIPPKQRLPADDLIELPEEDLPSAPFFEVNKAQNLRRTVTLGGPKASSSTSYSAEYCLSGQAIYQVEERQDIETPQVPIASTSANQIRSNLTTTATQSRKRTADEAFNSSAPGKKNSRPDDPFLEVAKQLTDKVGSFIDVRSNSVSYSAPQPTLKYLGQWLTFEQMYEDLGKLYYSLSCFYSVFYLFYTNAFCLRTIVCSCRRVPIVPLQRFQSIGR